MGDVKTWRELLGKIISTPSEKQRIADALQVNPVTLVRWYNQGSTPRHEKLRRLLDVLPSYREQFSALLLKEFPDLLDERFAQNILTREIPSAFYGQALNAYASSPITLRTSTLSVLLLQQMLIHLDPLQHGLSCVLIQCMPPGPDGKVRSLRKIYGRGTLPWVNHDYQTQLFGAESQVGQAALLGHPIIVQSREEYSRLFTHKQIEEEESKLAYPLIQADYVAGCLCVTSTQKNVFSQIHLDLIKGYADLLLLAFTESDFYNLRLLELGIMPEEQKQESYLASFHIRASEKMIRASQQQLPVTRQQAELLAWQEIESELLAYTLQHPI